MTQQLSNLEQDILMFGFQNVILTETELSKIYSSDTTKKDLTLALTTLLTYGVKFDVSRKIYDFSSVNVNKLKDVNFDLLNEIYEIEHIKSRLDSLKSLKRASFWSSFISTILFIAPYFVLLLLLSFFSFKFLLICVTILLLDGLIYILVRPYIKSKSFGLKQSLNLQFLKIITNIGETDLKKINNSLFQLSQAVILGSSSSSYDKNIFFENYKRKLKLFLKNLYLKKSKNRLNLKKQLFLAYIINNTESFEKIDYIIPKSTQKMKFDLILKYFNMEKFKSECPFYILPLLSIIVLNALFTNLDGATLIGLHIALVPGSYYFSKYVINNFFNKSP